jgi:DNA-binding beta-propeller fold protein YncE
VDRCGAEGAPCDSCQDEIACTTDRCQAGACSNPLVPATCLIQATCHADLAVNPANPCKRCESQVAPYTWIWFLAQGCVLTLAGNGKGQLVDGPADMAEFALPHGVTADASTSAVYVADSTNYAIRKIEGGQVTTIAGTGKPGYVDGAAKTAQFSYPMGLAVDSAGTLFVADLNSHVIRRIESGQVTTFAGTTEGFWDGPAATAKFLEPHDVEVDASGALYVTDSGNGRIRKIAGGMVTTVAGDGSWGHQDGPAASAQFYSLRGLWVSPSGNEIYVADTGNQVVRRIANGQVTTVAGKVGSAGYKDGPAAEALFDRPWDVVKDSAGALFVADEYNSRIRKISGGVVTTVAGNGSYAFADGPANSAAFKEPSGIAARNGVIYIADSANRRIRHFRP